MARFPLVVIVLVLAAAAAAFFLGSRPNEVGAIRQATTPEQTGAQLVQSAEASEILSNPTIRSWQREGWKTDFSRIEIDVGEILSGGPPRDGIPSIDNPEFIAVADEDSIPDREPVISLVVNGDARAYPLRIMMWHEIANDVVGGTPVAVTYCPLCNAAIVFDATVDGIARDFGTTGKLRHSDLVMYDRQSETWWQQFSGRGIIGQHTGEKLTMIPSRLDSWGRFKAEHPDGQVLVPNNPRMRQYWRNPYGGYDTANSPFLFRGALPDNMPAMERVVLVRDGEPSAYTISLLEQEGQIIEGDVKLVWEPGQASALDTGKIEDGRDVGNVTVTRLSDGSPVVHDVTFAFVVNAFEPSLVIRTN